MKRSVENLLQEILTEQEIPGFLRSVARNLQYDYTNQLLIYAQRKDATHVSGRMAYKSMGIQLDETNPIRLVYPQLVDAGAGYQYRYIGVMAYSRTDVLGNVPEDETYHLMELIPERMQSTVEQGDDLELLEAYIRWILGRRIPFPEPVDRAIRLAVRYIVKVFFGIHPVSIGSVWKGVEHANTHDKALFLMESICSAQLIVYDLTGYCLNYEELCMYQQLIDSEQLSDIHRMLGDVENHTDSRDIKETLSRLRKKLNGVAGEELTRLNRLQKSRQLFSYPPVHLEEYQSGIFCQRSQGLLY